MDGDLVFCSVGYCWTGSLCMAPSTRWPPEAFLSYKNWALPKTRSRNKFLNNPEIKR